MSSVDRVLKKVEQERSKGNLDRALARLEEAIAEHPREFAVAKEAALAAFELGKSLDGVTVLRSAMRRCPQERDEALSIARFEFDSTASLEVGELLYDSYLAQPDFQKAREVVAALAAPDQKKLLSKLNTRIQSMHESVADEKRRLLGLRLAQAIAYSALKQPAEVADSLQHLLELDQKQVEIVGRLCKAELHKFSNCAEIRLLLARCYLLVQEPGLAAEQLLAQATDTAFREHAYGILETADDVVPLKHVRGVLQLLDNDVDAAHQTLSDLLSLDENSAVVVRQTLEKVAEIRDASPKLKLLYAEVLARTDQMARALKEIETVHDEGSANDDCLTVLDTLLQLEGQEPNVRRLRAKVALELGQSTEAAQDLRKAIESGGAHVQGLKSEIETVFQKADGDPTLGRTLVNLYVDENDPQKAVDTLSRMHELGQANSQELFDLASAIAGRFGFTSALAVLFVEVAIDVERLEDAQAAISHYLASPGAHVEEFTTSLTVLIRQRSELCEPLAQSLQSVELSPEMRVFVLRARFETGDLEAAVHDLEALVAADTHVTRQACEILEEYLESNEDTPAVLELLARLYTDHDKKIEAAGLLARAIVSDPSCSDRVCRQADRMLRLDPGQHELWRPLINALMDVNRQRHAREMCFQASQVITAEYQGFVHAAMAQIHLESGQLDNAIEAARQASECVDVPWQRLEVLLRRVVDQDPQHGYVHFLLGKALLALAGPASETVDHFEQATRHDSVTRELVLETLRDNRETLQNVPAALVLEGTLLLQRGDRTGGVALLGQVLKQSPESSDAVLRTLQAQWDQDPDDVETGLALAQALNNVDQLRRACRLLADLAERFPEHQAAAIDLLQEVLSKKPIAEAHQALWDIHLSNNEREKAVHHVQLALEDLATEPDAYRSLLETAHRQVPESIWVSCRMAELILADGNDTKAEAMLRSLLESNLSAAEQVIRVIEPRAEDSLDLALLQVDALLAGSQWMASLEALRSLKKSFHESDERCMERYRVLMERGDTELAANVDYGMQLREAGNVEEATRVFERTLELAVDRQIEDKEHEVRLTLASLYADLGREEEGRELLSTVIEEAEDPSEAYRFIEQVTRKGIVGKLKKLQESIRQSPGNLRARLELARLSLVSGDFGTARESLRFAGDSPVIEATRLYLLARSYSDDDQPQLAIAVLRSIGIDDVADDELRRNIVYLMATCSEQLGFYGEAHARFLRLLSEFPGYKDTHKRARETYQKHLETSLEIRPLVLEKRISFEMS